MIRPLALAYLAWRAIVAHPLRKLLRKLLRRGTGLERFRASYVSEGLVPTRLEDRAVAEAAASCIACGLCETACDLSLAPAPVRALGLHAAFRLYSRSTQELPLAAAALGACAGCEGCDALCPTGVPISLVVAQLRAESRRG